MNTEPLSRRPVRCHCSPPTVSHRAACDLGSRDQFHRHRRRVLLVVTLGDRGLVLVPVRELGIVVFEHQRQAVLEEAVDVSDVTGVLEDRPDVFGRPDRRVEGGQEWRPGRRVRPDGDTEFRPIDLGRVEATLGARALEHPGPVLGGRARSASRRRYSAGSRRPSSSSASSRIASKATSLSTGARSGSRRSAADGFPRRSSNTAKNRRAVRCGDRPGSDPRDLVMPGRTQAVDVRSRHRDERAGAVELSRPLDRAAQVITRQATVPFAAHPDDAHRDEHVTPRRRSVRHDRTQP